MEQTRAVSDIKSKSTYAAGTCVGTLVNPLVLLRAAAAVPVQEPPGVTPGAPGSLFVSAQRVKGRPEQDRQPSFDRAEALEKSQS